MNKINPTLEPETAIPIMHAIGTPATAAAPTLRRLAIVIRDDAYDRLLTPLTFAWEMARKSSNDSA